jgi:F0F1-type ATP synthase membrane subunit c/vacuolar-type H+-ATPase subunit K
MLRFIATVFGAGIALGLIGLVAGIGIGAAWERRHRATRHNTYS